MTVEQRQTFVQSVNTIAGAQSEFYVWTQSLMDLLTNANQENLDEVSHNYMHESKIVAMGFLKNCRKLPRKLDGTLKTNCHKKNEQDTLTFVSLSLCVSLKQEERCLTIMKMGLEGEGSEQNRNQLDKIFHKVHLDANLKVPVSM